MSVRLLYSKKGTFPCAPTVLGDDLIFSDSNSGAISSIPETDWEAGKSVYPSEWGDTGGQPRGLCATPNGSLYVCDLVHGSVLTIGKDGNPSKVVSEYEKNELKGPNSIALGSKGSMFFTDSGALGDTTLENPVGSVFCVDGTQKAQLLRPIALECLAHPSGIAVSPDGMAVFVCETLRNRVLRFVERPAGVWISSVFCTFTGGLGPTAIACQPHNKSSEYTLYIARADLAGCGRGVVTPVTSHGDVQASIVMPAPELSGLALSSDGAMIFVTETSTGSIYIVENL